jgi:hypothetical protein
MLLKVGRDPEPTTGTGRPYSAEECDYFWGRIASRIDALPSNLRHQVDRRTPSREVHKAILAAAGRGPVFTLTGRLRAAATYAARHNTIFQGLAADCAKLALWRLWRAGYRIVNFIHDEVVIEVPADVDLDRAVEEISTLLTAGKREVVPDVRVTVEAHVATAWSKGGEAVRDGSGRLIPWDPETHGTTGLGSGSSAMEMVPRGSPGTVPAPDALR